jgi:hypothetical protein
VNPLDAHKKIGWDMDQTLIQGRNSERFRAYIAANPHKRHHVITFRDREWADLIPIELGTLGLDPALIASVENCPAPLHDMFMLHRSGELEMPKHVAEKAISAFLRWKGRRASELGCTVLVDDMADWVVQGCQAHGVEFVDATIEVAAC